MSDTYHVVLYQVVKTPHETPIAARIEAYADGEAPRTVWSTMSHVDTQLDFIFGAVLQIVSAINQNLEQILSELERAGWSVGKETHADHQHDATTIYRTTHFLLRPRDADAR